MRTAADLIIEPHHSRDLVITRTFAAPRQLVFDAWTQPELLRRWYGPRGWHLTTCEIDLRAGGRFLYLLQRPNRADMALRGTYQAVDAPTRLVTSERWDDDWTEGETHTTTSFDERDGATTVTRIIEFTSAAARDRALGSIGRGGLEDAFQRLDDLVRAEPDDTARDDVGQRDVGRSDDGRDYIAGRYRRRAARFDELILGVGSDAWASQSPCEDWTARDIVDHVIVMHAAMLAPLGSSWEPKSATADRPIDAFASARARMQHALDDPAVAGTECSTPTGTLTVAEHVDAALSVDLVLHGWDLARATGQDDTIPAEDLALLWPIAQSIPEQFRVPGAFRPGLVVFGPQVPVAADAPLQHKILGLYGRDPAWQQ
ncbi:TIGR03086 family metal-binding protein [Kribbella sp. NPDC049174]|uniref:TIGR03086 family metal-binding protein n=1 Tax=Kribbella sp. NPDC049174 TaxID=3364112 RepID=UPI003712C19B